jgi:hypothetical protein
MPRHTAKPSKFIRPAIALVLKHVPAASSLAISYFAALGGWNTLPNIIKDLTGWGTSNVTLRLQVRTHLQAFDDILGTGTPTDHDNGGGHPWSEAAHLGAHLHT